MKNIGIDIGGTFIKAAIVENGKILLSSKTPTKKDGKMIPMQVVDIVNTLIKRAGMTMEDIKNIGIGAPGACDNRRGVIVNCPNIENCRNIDICAYVKKETGIPAWVDNDANCAALGEYMLLDEGSNCFVFVTLGTGVGGGIIVDGKILRGINMAAGEVGHIVIEKGGEKCNCGRYGCWERYASVTALIRQAKRAGLSGNVTGRSIFEERLQGSVKAREVIDRWILYIAEGICDLVNIFQPDTVVIGGGISREGDIILKPVEEFVKKYAFKGPMGSKECVVRISKLFNDAGVVGASYLNTQN